MLARLWQLVGVKPPYTPQLNLFACDTLAPSVLALHLVVWKMILIAFTLVDTNGEQFQAEEVWKGAVRRFISRVERLKVSVRIRAAKCRSSHSDLSLEHENKMLAPLGSFNEVGVFRWSDVVWKEIRRLDLDSRTAR